MLSCCRNKSSLIENPRRSGRKREDRSYVESPDIVIEEDYVSKPSPAKKPNLGHVKEKEKETKELDGVKKQQPGHTNGIEMESDEDTEDENLPPVPSVQVFLHFKISIFSPNSLNMEKELKSLILCFFSFLNVCLSSQLMIIVHQ